MRSNTGVVDSALLVLATVSTPAAEAALAPLFDSTIPVPMLRSADEAADALRSSPTMAALLHADALDAAANAASREGGIGVSALYRRTERACAEAADEEAIAAAAGDVAAAQRAALEEQW